MSKEEDKWMDDVLRSWQGSQRATPHPDLLRKIEERIAPPALRLVSKREWRLGVAAAIALLLINGFAWQSMQADTAYGQETMAYESNEGGLISDYNIYE